MSRPVCFPEGTIPFLKMLVKNNNREWFHENKANYELVIREPALNFIEAMAPELEKISPHFRALPKKVGGSLMRVYRDTRFAKDKTPYKTNIGIQFRHELGKDVHAPGFYLHIEEGGCFIGVGIWRPDSLSLNKIRDFIVDNPVAWGRAKNHQPFKTNFQLEGDRLKRAPRGYPADHPLLDDLKWKDFIACAYFDQAEIMKPGFCQYVAKHFAQASLFMSYLCMALGVNYSERTV